ncbi:hypothetical protein [Rhizobium calliandrae]
MVTAQVDKFFRRFDFGESPCVKFVLLNREISDQTVAAFAKHGLDR